MYPWKLFFKNEEHARNDCKAALTGSYNSITNKGSWNKLRDKIQKIQETALATNGLLLVTGYARFFADPPRQGDKCDSTYFFPKLIFDVRLLKMEWQTRKEMNHLVNSVNNRIANVVKQAGSRVQFIDIDAGFEGHRFCEPSNDDDPIGANKPQVWFNSIQTLSSPEDQAELELQLRGIRDSLQQASVFHPKFNAHNKTASVLAERIASLRIQHLFHGGS